VKWFAALFVGMFVYGMLTAHTGAGLIALLCAAGSLYADRKFKQDEQRWRQDPRNATVQKDTLRRLEDLECECLSSRI
jgi:hypothetical protein